MSKIYNIRFLITSICFFLLTNTLISFPLYAVTEFYVDPDWAGTQSGAASEPWVSLDNSWSAIDNALANDDVTIYFSAREAGSDTEEVSTSSIKLERTDNSTNILTLDGMSKYNTSDSSPSWSDYGGTLKHVVRNTNNASISTDNGNTVLDRNYIIIKGFFCNPGFGGQQGIFLKQFSNGIVENCKIVSQSGHAQGPALILTYDSNDPVNTRSQTVIIKNNIFQDNYGEAIYVNGCKDVAVCSVAQDDILIEGNTIMNTGSEGGQGDGIDIKNFVTNAIVRGNTIYGCTHEGIVSNSAITVEQNFIYDTGGNGIRFVDYGPYDHKDISLNGGDIRNNIVVDVKGKNGIRIHSVSGDYDFRNTKVVHNTIYNLTSINSKGISITGDTKSVDVLNNIVAKINGQEFYVDAIGALNNSDFNCFYDDDGSSIIYNYAGTSKTASNLTDVEPHSLAVDPLFVSSGKPYKEIGFVPEINSLISEAGTVLMDVDNDYFDHQRLQSIRSMGAVTPYFIIISPPQNPRIISQ